MFLTFWSGLPTSIQVPSSAGGSSNTTGEILLSDFTLDGTAGDLMPGTTVGNFGRGVSISGLNNLISNFNSTFATNVTPAGQALVNAGLFSQAQVCVRLT